MTNANPSDRARITFMDLEKSLANVANSFKNWADVGYGDTPTNNLRNAVTELVIDLASSFLAAAKARLSSLPVDSLDSLDSLVRKITTDFNAAIFVDETNYARDLAPAFSWVRKFLVPTLDPKSMPFMQPMTQDEADKFSVLEGRANDLNSHLERAIEAQRDTVRLDDQARLSEALRARLTALEKEYSKYSSDLTSIAEENGNLRETFHRATQATKDLDAVREQYEALNERKSKDKLVHHFGEFHGKHNVASRYYLIFGLALIVATGAFAVFHALQLPVSISLGPSIIGTLAWKLTVVGGGTALSTYLLRLASYHRKLAVWSDTVQVQLQTFTPYIQQIGDEASKDKLRIEFARRVFGGEPGNSADPQESSSDLAAVTELSALIANVAKIQGAK
ncbi:hypothetical protein ACNPM8_01565 [Glutamicibacter sp. AGC46]